MKPFYIDLREARNALADIGIEITEKQIRRAAEPDFRGKRKLPFFVDPIDGRLKINKDTLLSIYFKRHAEAENNMRITI